LFFSKVSNRLNVPSHLRLGVERDGEVAHSSVAREYRLPMVGAELPVVSQQGNRRFLPVRYAEMPSLYITVMSIEL
jgi:hypothetical protein